MLNKYKGKMFCFSPPVMLATFIIEFSFAFYTLWRYKLNTVRRLAFVMLIALGTFQLAEYMVCGGLGWTNVEWARVGYGAIALLPALGIHLILSIAGKKMPILTAAAYISCAAFVIFYLFGESAITGQACYANYAVFDTHRASVWPFAFYYYGWLMVGTYLAWKLGSEQPQHQKALRSMAIGYLVFILPTTAFNIIDPATTYGIPSIMCGFAVIFAFTLMMHVLPNSCEVRSTFQTLREKLQLRI